MNRSMQIIPVALLILATILDLVNALVQLVTNFELLPELGKWTNIVSALLCLMATLASAILLIAKKYTSKFIGLAVTFLSSLMTATFVAWTVSWFN